MRRIWAGIICAILIGLFFLFWPRRRGRSDAERLRPQTEPAPPPYKPPAVQPQPEKKPAVTVSRAAPEPAPPKPLEDRADDLTLLEGIGPKIAAALNAAGIKTYARLSALPPQEIERIVKAAGVRMVGHAESWPRQARLAADGKLDELKAYQQTLRASRRLSGKT